jgi:hypothetical protein
MAIVESYFDPQKRLVVTRLQGTITLEQVQGWKEEVYKALATLEDNTSFKWLVDLWGYYYSQLAVHKQMRGFIPSTLAEYGFRTGLLDLFEGVTLPLSQTRGITCLAVAHLHHDQDKMYQYDQQLGKENERFFSDFSQAYHWLESWPSIELKT